MKKKEEKQKNKTTKKIACFLQRVTEMSATTAVENSIYSRHPARGHRLIQYPMAAKRK